MGWWVSLPPFSLHSVANLSPHPKLLTNPRWSACQVDRCGWRERDRAGWRERARSATQTQGVPHGADRRVSRRRDPLTLTPHRPMPKPAQTMHTHPENRGRPAPYALCVHLRAKLCVLSAIKPGASDAGQT